MKKRLQSHGARPFVLGNMTDLYAAMEQAGTRGYNIAVDGRYHSHRGTYRGALELMRQLRDMFPLRAQNRITATDCFNGEVWQG